MLVSSPVVREKVWRKPVGGNVHTLGTAAFPPTTMGSAIVYMNILDSGVKHHSYE